MRHRLRRQLTTLLALALLFAAGLLAAGYVLLHERLPNPLTKTYRISAMLQAANGVVPGLGQPVNVAGVAVGQVTGAELKNGQAEITMTLDRSKLPHVYADATAALDPITPLGDVEINLSPGKPPARPLTAGQTLPIGQTSSPVQLEDLLSNLDGDTRDWLSSLLASLGQGTDGTAAGLHDALVTLGPSAGQLKDITAALATRRRSLAQLVHNVSIVTHAATDDGQLSRVIVAGDQTLHALAGQDGALRRSVAALPGALGRTDTTLADLRTFAGRLGPTLNGLLPAVRRLPSTLSTLKPFASIATTALRTGVRPVVRQATPLLQQLAPATSELSALTPDLTDSAQSLNYLLNEVAYNPQGKNQGYLYWLDWFFHNWNSLASSGDANGTVARASVSINCSAAANMVQLGSLLESIIGATGAC